MSSENASGWTRRTANYLALTAWGSALGAIVMWPDPWWHFLIPPVAILAVGMAIIGIDAVVHDREGTDG